jgi:pimeloyl-ACP methyl ester carboxylesterase
MAAQPGCEVQGFDTGHWVMLQKPEGFNAAVGAWLALTNQK